ERACLESKCTVLNRTEGSTNSPGANLNVAAKRRRPRRGGGQDARNNPDRTPRSGQEIEFGGEAEQI
ncbi:hypothetical protein ACFL1V_03545, partial [Pseudomonadota bacterium]